MEENMEISFEMIMHAGDAKMNALEAIDLIVEGKYEEAEEKIKEAENEYTKAHRAHKGLLDQIMRDGKTISMDLILTHALDHTTMAEMSIMMAQKMLILAKKLG